MAVFKKALIVLLFSLLILNLAPLKFLTVTSDSMSPAIKRGSLLLVAKSPAYQEGEIVSFISPSGQLITHRLVKIVAEGDGVFYQSRGDANANPDQVLIKESDILGRVRVNLPWLGLPVIALKKPAGFIFLILLPLTLILYEEVKAAGREILKHYHHGSAKQRPVRRNNQSSLFRFKKVVAGRISRKSFKSRQSLKKRRQALP